MRDDPAGRGSQEPVPGLFGLVDDLLDVVLKDALLFHLGCNVRRDPQLHCLVLLLFGHGLSPYLCEHSTSQKPPVLTSFRQRRTESRSPARVPIEDQVEDVV